MNRRLMARGSELCFSVVGNQYLAQAVHSE